MPYTPTNWVEGVTTLGPTNMNKIETELVALDTGKANIDGSGNILLSATGQIIWAGDTNLYRSSAAMLKTDSDFVLGKALWANQGTGSEVVVGSNGSATTSGIYFGSARDTNLYRSAADLLKTDDSFQVMFNLIAQTNLYVDYGNAGNKILFGSAGDTNLYRQSAGVLKTDSSFWSPSNIVARQGSAAGQLFLGDPGSGAGLWFGTAYDTFIYRPAANSLQVQTSLGTAVIFDMPGAGNTSMQLNLPGVGMRRVYPGGPDSAGAGYRTLFVSN